MSDFFGYFLNIILNFILWIISYLPELPIEIESISGFIDLVNLTSCFMPWKTFFIALGIWIAFQNFRFVISVGNWIISKIPFIN